MLNYKNTPVQELQETLFREKGVRVMIKREDLNHQEVSGNKWWKLKYNLNEAMVLGHNTLLTFGGAYSNHIYSTAAAGHALGLKSIGVIRGEETLPLNSTLAFAISKGMALHYVARDNYSRKTDQSFIQELKNRYGNFFLIPEGGSNELAVKGCEEFGKKILNEIDFDCLCLPVGTGGTMAGLISGLNGKKEIVGISVLKGGDFLKNDIATLIEKYSGKAYGNWSLLTSYHHGGYAKVTKELLEFTEAMKVRHSLPLDVVYTAKMFWAVMEEIKNDRFRRGTTLLLLHTGGLQGLNSLPNRYGKNPT